MSSKEENKKNSADFATERNLYLTRQSNSNKLIPPRIQPMTSAKASEEVPENNSADSSEVEVDSKSTVKAVMEALVTVGDDASKHLSTEDKKYIKEKCLKEEYGYKEAGIVLGLLSLGYFAGSYMSKNED